MAENERKEGVQLEIEKRYYRLIGITPILGGMPANPQVREAYIASKAPSTELMEEENANGYSRDDVGVTVFARDDKDRLCLMGYHLKGYLKEALTSIRQQACVANARSKVDTLIFIEPRYIPITKDGYAIKEEDKMLERSLRANTMQGPRCTLASSEMVYDPWEIEIEIACIPNAGTAKSKPINWQEIELALSYGEYHGLGQWRNAGYGQFRWERLD